MTPRLLGYALLGAFAALVALGSGCGKQAASPPANPLASKLSRPKALATGLIDAPLSRSSS